MVNLADHVEIKNKWRIVPANSLTSPLVNHAVDESSKIEARKNIFVFLARALFAYDMIPGRGLGGGTWLKDGHMHYYCPTSDFQVPADFMANSGFVEYNSGTYRLPVPFETLESHARVTFPNVTDHETMIAHALLLGNVFWDETSIWKGLQYGDYFWQADTSEQRELRFARAREVLYLIPALHTLALVELDDSDDRYMPTPALQRIGDILV